MKICSKCGIEKTPESFNKCARNKDGLHAYCRDCHKAHYRNNKDRHYQNVKKVRAAYREKVLEELRKILIVGCVDCGNDDLRVLDFDHVRGTKVENVMTMVRNGARLSTILEEVAKCEVRCRNCHAIQTYNRLGHTWRSAPVG